MAKISQISPLAFLHGSAMLEKKALVASYGNQCLVSYGEGGNRHLYLSYTSVTAKEIAEDATVLHKAQHIWVDEHSGKFYAFVYESTDHNIAVKMALASTATKTENWGAGNCHYFTKEDLEKFVVALVDTLR